MIRNTWNAALAEYRREETDYAASAAEYEAQCQRYYEAHPDRSKEFAAYGLIAARGRADAIRTALLHLCHMHGAAKGDGAKLTDSDLREINAEADRIVDDYFADRESGKEAFERFIGAGERKHDRAVDKMHEAREALLLAPAPDAEAMLLKLDILAAYVREADGEDADHIASIRDDAHRLFREA